MGEVDMQTTCMVGWSVTVAVKMHAASVVTASDTDADERGVGCLSCPLTGPRVWLFFFFQAEDGIRDVAVTGVQTCALPIYGGACRRRQGKELGINLIHRREIIDVLEEDRGLHHVVHVRARRLQDPFYVLERAFGLLLDIRANELSRLRIERHLS